MPLHCPRTARERILAMGSAGSGKTRMWLSIAKMVEKTHAPSIFYVIDTDMAVERMVSGETFESLEGRIQYMVWDQNALVPPHLTRDKRLGLKGSFVKDEARGLVEDPRLVVFEPYEWPEYMDALKQSIHAITNEDWLIVDLANPAWDVVQDFYIDLIFNRESADFYLAARETNKKGGALDGDKDWSNINKLYREFSQPLLRLRGHLFLCTGVKGVQTEGGRVDPKEIRVLFGPHGVKPEGQKALPFMTHTIIYVKEFTPGVWKMTAVKDRERTKVEDVTVNDFVMQYMLPVAGWKLS